MSEGQSRALGGWLTMSVAVIILAGAVNGWNCVCNPTDCEVLEPSGCPGLGIVVWDPCRCCKVCARTLGEDCGGFRGTCEPGLKCYEATEQIVALNRFSESMVIMDLPLLSGKSESHVAQPIKRMK